MATYTNTQVAEIFEVERQTVLRWAKDFKEFLSPMANPGDGITHEYTMEDIEKLALIRDMRKLRRPTDAIAAALMNGEIGTPPDDVQALSFLGSDIIPPQYQKRVEALEKEITILKQEKQSLYEGKLKSDAKAEELREIIKQKDEELKQAYLQLGQFKK